MYINANDIQSTTGLDYHYILKAVKKLDNIFTSDVLKRGSNNSLLFSSDFAYSIFDKIKQLKNDGYTLKLMKPYFESTLLKPDSNKVNNEQDQIKMESIDSIIKKLEEVNKRSFDVVFEKLVKSKEEQIETLQSKMMLMLPSGVSEIEFQNSQKSKDEKIVQLETELKFKDELIQGLKEYQSKIQKLRPLIYELQNLDGNLFSANQRKKLFSDIMKFL